MLSSHGTTPQQTKRGYKYFSSLFILGALLIGITFYSVTSASAQSATVTPSTSFKNQVHVTHHHIQQLKTAPAYNNTALSDNTNPSSADFDGNGNSYSAQDFQQFDWQPGDDLNFNGMDLIWPAVPAGVPDNYLADGQNLPITPVQNADTIGFVGAATQGPASGKAKIHYTDGTTQTFTLAFSDWTLDTFTQAPVSTNRYFAEVLHTNTPQGQLNSGVFLFYTQQKLLPGKTVKSVQLPSKVTGGQLHVFSIGTRANGSYFNNVGTTSDSSPLFGNIDGSGNSYSTQALKEAGIYPGQNVVINDVNFLWQEGFSVIQDNYQADGQVVSVNPSDGATTLAFLGASTNGSVSGDATITYTDGSSQQFTLGFTNWLSTDAPLFGNTIVATLPYMNSSTAGEVSVTNNVYYAETTLQADKTVQSVTLPTASTAGQIHIFSIGTK